MDGKNKHRVHIKFRMELGKSTTETLEMLHEAFEEHSLLGWAAVSHVSQPVECQLKMMNVQSDHHQENTENVEKIQELIHKGHRRTLHKLQDIVGISYGVCQEILTENLNMRYTAPKFVTRQPTHP
jgi:hypothetical protein